MVAPSLRHDPLPDPDPELEPISTEDRLYALLADGQRALVAELRGVRKDFGEALRANTAAVTGLAHQIEARGATEARAVTSGLLRLGAVGLLALVTLAALLVGARFAFGLGALSISTGGP
jgi:hypothetical protein